MYGVEALAPGVAAAAVAVMGVVATVAILVPAWRAADLDPAAVLRSE
jgi:ABC-type antimicrobial peptide transport system permease subunit